MAALAATNRSKTFQPTELSVYFQQISKPRLLTADQEIELAQRVRSGDRAAATELAEANLRLVIKIARKFCHPDLTLADLVQEGNLGLMEAVKKFDPAKGCRFSTYACWWIRQAISRAIANKGRAIRLPVHINDLLSKYKHLNERVRAESGSDATLQQAAAELFPIDPDNALKKARRKYRRQPELVQTHLKSVVRKMEVRSQDKLREILSMSLQPISLEVSLSDNSEMTLKDLIPGETDVSTPNLERANLAWLMSHLSERERQILTLRYGLDGSETRTFAELAYLLGISRESVRQQELKALKKLRDLIDRDHWN